jgi:hypothetical protein
MMTGTAGTGSSSYPMTASGAWRIQIASSMPTCPGQMLTTLTQQSANAPIEVSGNWNCAESGAECLYIQQYQNASFQCLQFSGSLSGSIMGNMITLTLSTASNTSISVSGTIASGTIVGTAHFSNADVSFNAIAQ